MISSLNVWKQLMDSRSRSCYFNQSINSSWMQIRSWLFLWDVKHKIHHLYTNWLEIIITSLQCQKWCNKIQDKCWINWAAAHYKDRSTTISFLPLDMNTWEKMQQHRQQLSRLLSSKMPTASRVNYRSAVPRQWILEINMSSTIPFKNLGKSCKRFFC